MIAVLLVSALLHTPASAPRVVLQGPHANCGTLAANEVCVGGAFNLVFDAHADNTAAITTDYPVFRNGVQIAAVPFAALVANVGTVSQTLATAGTYDYRVDARGPSGSMPSNVLKVVAKPVVAIPSAPSLLRLIRINP